MGKKESKKTNVVDVSLKPTYTSLFVEDGKLKSEQITITKQKKESQNRGNSYSH